VVCPTEYLATGNKNPLGEDRRGEPAPSLVKRRAGGPPVERRVVDLDRIQLALALPTPTDGVDLALESDCGGMFE
jgi:hypothetical protein